MSLTYYMDAKYIGRVTPEELAVIRGCLLNGASIPEVYDAFEGRFLISIIADIYEELVVNERLKK